MSKELGEKELLASLKDWARAFGQNYSFTIEDSQAHKQICSIIKQHFDLSKAIERLCDDIEKRLAKPKVSREWVAYLIALILTTDDYKERIDIACRELQEKGVGVEDDSNS